MTPNQIKDALKDRMKTEGLSTVEVSNRTGIVQSGVHLKLHGKRPMRLEDACAIAGACGLALRITRHRR